MVPGQSKKDEVAEKLARGLTPREIAVLLQISTQAVYKHKAQIEAEAEQVAESTGGSVV